MFGLSKEKLESLRKEYPAGARVRLIRMDDPYEKMPEGTTGTVTCVDDAGQIHVDWDGYGTLALICGEDRWEKIR